MQVLDCHLQLTDCFCEYKLREDDGNCHPFSLPQDLSPCTVIAARDVEVKDRPGTGENSGQATPKDRHRTAFGWAFLPSCVFRSRIWGCAVRAFDRVEKKEECAYGAQGQGTRSAHLDVS